MFCARIDGECPHIVFPDPNYIFVLMPFENSESIYSSIERGVKSVSNKHYICERADKKYSSYDIWCKKICRSIRRAKYLIVDATGSNANVFYELGFAHALGHTKNIIITRESTKVIPFNISGFSYIRYSEKNLPALEQKLKKILMDLEDEEINREEVKQTPEEMINKLKANLHEEEERTDKYKREIREAEKQEETLKKRIKELEAIVLNPEKETKKLLEKKEDEIENLQKELALLSQKQKREILFLQEKIEEDQKQYEALKNELQKFKNTGDSEKLSLKASETKKADWKAELFDQGRELRLQGEIDEAITIFSDLIEKDPKYKKAYTQRAYCLRDKKLFNGALADLNRAILLDPKDAKAYSNRGLVYSRLGDKERSLWDLDKALQLKPDDIPILLNKAEVLVIHGEPLEAEKLIRDTLKKADLVEHQAVGHYLLSISLKLQNKKTQRINEKLDNLLKAEFETEWTFVELEIWLRKVKIDREVKDYIRQKIRLLKKHRQRKTKTN